MPSLCGSPHTPPMPWTGHPECQVCKTGHLHCKWPNIKHRIDFDTVLELILDLGLTHSRGRIGHMPSSIRITQAIIKGILAIY